MTAHRIVASFPQSPLSVGGRSDMKQTEVESTTNFDDDYETLKDRVIGTTDPDTSFERFFSVILKLLEGLGLFSTNFRLSGKLTNTNTRTVLPVLFSVSQMMFLSVCEFRASLRFWITDADLAIAAFTALIPSCLSIFKGFRLWMCQVELREILIRLAILWEMSRFRVNVQQRTLKIAERARHVATWYLGTAIFIAINIGARPCLLLLHFRLRHEDSEIYDYSVTSMPAIYPFSTDTFVKYLACISWEMVVVLFVVLYWAAADLMFAELVSHLTIQFQVLNYDLRNIGAESKLTSAIDEKILLRKLCSITKRHSQLHGLCKMFEAIYNPTIFMIMVSTSVMLCFCALSVHKGINNGNHDQVVTNIVNLVIIIGQSMIYCGYADNLTDQHLNIADAAYHCHWIDRSKSFKINLQIIMMRAQKYYCLSGYGLFHLTLTQITAIVNTSLSYFTLLRTLT